MAAFNGRRRFTQTLPCHGSTQSMTLGPLFGRYSRMESENGPGTGRQSLHIFGLMSHRDMGCLTDYAALPWHMRP